ncbi:MAG: tetratricopeptide repeat protein [Saprospiraceae bacterium]|nr:tetratricopeptide repeat protein [Saprospiraceae bacterium]
MVQTLEAQLDAEFVGYWESEDFLAIIDHYMESGLIEKALRVVNLSCLRYRFQYEHYLLKARLLFLISRSDLALDVLEEAQDIAPKEPEIRLLRGEILCACGQLQQALMEYEDIKCEVFGEDLSHVLIRESYIHESMKDFASMFYSLKQVLEIDPDNNEALEQIWMSVELSKKYEESIELHKAIIDKNPYNYRAWFNIGHAYSCIGEYELAIDALEYAFIIDPDFEAAYMDCAEICFQVKQYDRAFNIYEEGIERFGPDAETLVFMVECLMPLGRSTEARDLLLKALTIDPYNDEVHFYLGECHSANRKWKAAIKAYNKAIKIEDRREEYHASIANAYEHMGDLELANHYYKKSTHIASEQNQYWIKYATFARKHKSLEAALDILNKADLFAVGADLMYHKAACMYELGLESQAIEVLEDALMEDPTWVKNFIELCPSILKHDKITAMIEYYCGEQIIRE